MKNKRNIHQGWGQILQKGSKAKSKSFQIFQIQILSFSKGLNPNPFPKGN